MRGLPLTRGLDRLVDRPTRFLVALSSINDAPCKWNSHKLAKQLANLTNNSLNPLKKLASCEKRDSPMDAKELKTAIRQLKSSCTDNQSVEVRESVGKMPSSIAETISAFANGSGGAIVLGLSEKNGFEPAERLEAHRIADALSQACSDKLTPPARASIDILEYDGANVVVATIDEIPLRDKPCFVKGKGMYQGSFIRSFDGDRKLSPYEINRLLEDKTQPSPAAVREAVCNALMHRDYSELARGTQVQVNLYDNRLEFLSPGGLYGTVTAATVASAGYSSTRNQYLADILESTPYEGGFVAENRGTGFKLMGIELGRNRMEAPVVRDLVAMFSLEFRRRTDQSSIGSAYDEIVSFVSANEPCGAGEISAGLNIPRSTVTHRLKKLVGEKRLEGIGTERSRNQKYRLP